MTFRAVTRLTVATLLVALPACKDSTGSIAVRSGSLSFRYSGALDSTFSAEGKFTGQPNASTTAYAAAARTLSNGFPIITILAVSPRTGGRADFANFALDDVSAPTTLSLDLSKCNDTGSGCNLGLIGFNFDFTQDTVVAGERTFLTDSGTVQITSVTSGRIKGTFTAYARDVDSSPADTAGSQLRLTQGTFDVPLISGTTFGGNRVSTNGATLAPARFRDIPLLRARAVQRTLALPAPHN